MRTQVKITIFELECPLQAEAHGEYQLRDRPNGIGVTSYRDDVQEACAEYRWQGDIHICGFLFDCSGELVLENPEDEEQVGEMLRAAGIRILSSQRLVSTRIDYASGGRQWYRGEHVLATEE